LQPQCRGDLRWYRSNRHELIDLRAGDPIDSQAGHQLPDREGPPNSVAVISPLGDNVQFKKAHTLAGPAQGNLHRSSHLPIVTPQIHGHALEALVELELTDPSLEEESLLKVGRTDLEIKAHLRGFPDLDDIGIESQIGYPRH